ncbi:MAG: PAS domain-containing protein [Planctomycetes bacterium]|nr:PAS domain-containing protein [Planctomycetota bacterium]
MSDLIRTELTASAERELENVVRLVNSASSRQRSALDALSEGTSQIIERADGAARAARAVQESADAAHRQANSGAVGIGDANSKLDRLRSSFENIANLLKEIGRLSDQIDLLALNANIEAEKAGQAGKRFSVVAAEVKDLAHRTQRSKEAIDAVVGELFGDLDTLTSALGRSTDEITKALQAAVTSRQAGETIAAELVALSSLTTHAGESIDEVRGVSEFVDRSMHDMGVIGTTFEAMLSHMRAKGLLREHNDPLARLGDLVAQSTFHDGSRFQRLGQESVLNDQDIIISFTDTKGMIQYANNAFCRFAEFEPDELIGRPHNIIRHPDMPKTAFADLWQVIQSGELWQGYVINRTKTGRHYWVKATVFPYLKAGRLEGYISVRFKPEPGAVARAMEAYRRLP